LQIDDSSVCFLKEILRLHFQVIEDFGGSHGVRDEGRLSSVVEAPKQVVFGKEQYPTIFDKAAVYMRNIIGIIRSAMVINEQELLYLLFFVA